jgi:TIR domain
MPTQNEIFFSYAWGDEKETGESRENLVNDLYESLVQDGYHVIRDKYDLGYRGYISDFMVKIGQGKNVIVAISQKYVKSPYCMFELYEIARNSNFDKYQFSKKVLPIMIDFIDFNKPEILQEYLFVWKAEFIKWESLVKESAEQLSVEQFQRFNQIKKISQNFAELAGWLVDMNTLNPALLSKDNFDEIKKTIQAGTGPVQTQTEEEEITKGTLKGGITINNEGAKIGQQNIDSNIDNHGANFNLQ